MATIKGNKKRIRQAKNHRWKVDYEEEDLSHLPAEAQEYMRLFLNEHYFNTRDSDPSKHIYKDTVDTLGNAVPAMRHYGLYKAYNAAERDLYARLSIAGDPIPLHTLPVDAFTVSSNEDSILNAIDMQREAESTGHALATASAGSRPLDLTVTLSSGQSVVGTTFVSQGGRVLVRDLRSDKKLWPDDREEATKLLFAARKQLENTYGA